MNILLVSNDKVKAEEISSKLVFLRADDKVILSEYIVTKRNIEAYRPKIVLIHEDSDRETVTDLIGNIKDKFEYVVILISKAYDADFILSCIDCGADDFILENADDFEYVIRIIKHLKYFDNKSAAFRNTKLLEEFNVINKETGLYTKDYAKLSLETTIDNELISNGSFMVISPDKNDKQNYSAEKLANAIKLSIRACDISAHGKSTKCCVFMPYSDMNGAIAVFNKIKEQVDFKIHAGISDIFGLTLDEYEKHALKALTEANAVNADYILYQKEDKTLNNWLDDSPKKNYKIFRQIFNKKLEKVIVPVFYRLQQIYDGKLFNTKISQEINEKECFFNISNDEHESTLNIIYPGFSKIIISITHKGLNSPENREISLKLSEINEKGLISIIEDFVKEFSSK